MKKKIIWIIVVVIIILGIFIYTSHRTSRSMNSNIAHVQDITTTPLPDVLGVKTLRIVSAESQTQFSLSEVLRGKPNVVVGTTHSLAGDIQVTASPAKLTIGEIKIAAATLKTDNEFRNKSLNAFILKTSDNPYITFTPTKISGLPTNIIVDTPFTYTITGDLTIIGKTKSVAFNATSTLKADGSLVGSADTIVTYSDFNISVPELPFLANVEKTTKLSISIVAK